MDAVYMSENSAAALEIIVKSIDTRKFSIPLTEKILKKNYWYLEHFSHPNLKQAFVPDLPQVFNEEISEWVDQCEDFCGCKVWYWEAKGAWCYQYEYGTFVFDIKSVGELEIILAREGFVFSFDV